MTYPSRRSNPQARPTPNVRSELILRVAENRVYINDYVFTTGSQEQVAAGLERLLSTRNPELVVTTNVDQILCLNDNPGLVEAYKTAAMRLIDGMPIVLLARALGARGAQRHTGADLLPRCVKQSHEQGWRIAITGGADKVGRDAVTRLRHLHPDSDLYHIPFPMIKSIDDLATREVVRALKSISPDLVFLCLGSPKQEEWFLHWRNELPPAVYIGTGAAVDFAAGSKSRAPALVQVSGLEWMWRLGQEPRRLAYRYMVRGPKFINILLASLKEEIVRR